MPFAHFLKPYGAEIGHCLFQCLLQSGGCLFVCACIGNHFFKLCGQVVTMADFACQIAFVFVQIFAVDFNAWNHIPSVHVQNFLWQTEITVNKTTVGCFGHHNVVNCDVCTLFVQCGDGVVYADGVHCYALFVTGYVFVCGCDLLFDLFNCCHCCESF